jgi:3-hydroxyacyl-CoA dehydrogenase/enoyl-CoA hydratase/3-hydroxybutyryl-CoA epimerase
MKSTTILGLECFNLIGEGKIIRPSSTERSASIAEFILIIDSLSIKSFDEILHSNINTDKHLKNFLQPSAIYVIEKMSHGFNRLGKAHGKGFFNYDTDPPTLWSGLKVFEKRKVNIPDQDVTDRLTFAAVIGALQTTEEEAASIDPEIKALIPPGLPLSRQEALSWIDNYGEARFAARMAELAAAYGKRFADPRSAAPGAI